MATIAEQIAGFEQKRASLVAANETIMTKAADDGTTLDEEQSEAFDGNKADIEAIDKHLDRLRAMGKAAASTAVPVNGEDPDKASASRGGERIPVRVEKKLEPGIAFARIAKVKALASKDQMSVREKARDLYGEQSETFAHFNKAAVTATDTSSALVGDESSAFADFVEYLRPMTIIGKFGQNGVPALRRVPFRTPLVGQSTAGSANWVGEGKGKPVTKPDFTRTTLDPLKVAAITVATEEALRDSSPAAEGILRDDLAAAVAERLDRDFIDPAKAAVAGVSPASITNGVTFRVASGTDVDALRADVQAVFANFIAANNAPTSGVWIMNGITALAISMLRNPLGQKEYPDLNMGGGTFEGLPVIVSEYVPNDYDPDDAGAAEAGSLIALVNASDIYLGDDGGMAVDLSREASIEMADNPTQDSTGPTAAQLVSMFQTNSVALRAERTINWAKRRATAVAAIASANYA
ncbi:phage major capsid protein [Sphingomicrobium sp. XHP0239]|uniref:phage major capsid protein n=1 Tax=Sphingomicrobium maritimum TaxID=3133972 RepID=UPI0031CC8D1E